MSVQVLLALALVALIVTTLLLARARVAERELRARVREAAAELELERELAEGGRQRMIDAMNEAYVAIGAGGEVLDWNEGAVRIFGYEREEAIGRDAKELIVPAADHAEFDSLISRATGKEGEARPIELRLDRKALHKDGTEFTVELAAATMSERGEVSLHTFMHDVSDRVAVREELERHAADLEALSEAMRVLAGTASPEDARRAICGTAASIADADVAVLFEPDRAGEGLQASASEGASVAGELLPFSGEPSGAIRTFRSGEQLFVADLAEHAWVASKLVARTGSASALWTPIGGERARTGVIVVAWAERRDEAPERLRRVMSLFAAEAGAAIERANLLDRLARMAITDDLTGLPNRRAWDRELDREMKRALRGGAELSVAMVDLDHFKLFNDRRGHQAGDRLLKQAAAAWKEALRATDLLARYGGEEFSVALPACGSEAAERLIERLRRATPESESCSAGLVTWDRSETADELVGRADRALYEAKQAGRNKTVAR